MLVIVIDNGADGTIRMHQEREFPGRVSGTTLKNPDFTALARAYGCWAETVERTDDFAPALDRATRASRSRVVAGTPLGGAGRRLTARTASSRRTEERRVGTWGVRTF